MLAVQQSIGRRSRALSILIGSLLAIPSLVAPSAAQPVRATSSVDPYVVPPVIDVNPDPGIVETTIVADETTVDIGGGVMADAMAFNGAIPGPEFRLTVGQRVIVHFENDLDSEPSGIHWHGIELANNFDGTPLTQNQVAPGDAFLYDFVVTRPGVFWYHPHHEFSTNQVFRGLYGSLIVTDPNEAPLIAAGTLPSASDTRTLVLTDITVCKAPGGNDAATYDPSLPWVGGGPLPVQPAPTPTDLCDTPFDYHGDPLPGALAAGSVPNIQSHEGARVNEGQTVLTNGMNVGARAGDPGSPGMLAGGASVLSVLPGQGMRLQLVNAATTRFFRLRLTADDGSPIPLVRIGGQGGLLDAATLEGSVPGGFDFKYDSGEILLDPGDRADVVAAIPATASGVATLWTEDFQRTGGATMWSNIPTVPVAHFAVNGTAVSPAFSIGDGTPLRAATGDPVDVLPAPTATLLDPATFSTAKTGLAAQNIQFTTSDGPSIDGFKGSHDYTIDYAVLPAPGSARYAALGETLELSVENVTAAHHPFHLHGFSIQPITYSGCPGAVSGFTFPRVEFLDNINVPAGCTLTYRLHLEDRPLADGVTLGGALGRWMFHCHIFFHHHHGMASELVVTDANGNERPFVDAEDPLVTVLEGGTAAMSGTLTEPEGDLVTLNASLGSVTDNGDGTWSWNYAAPDGALEQYVYVTAIDQHGNKGQAAFLLVVESVPPTVVIDPAQVMAIDEGDTLSVLATFTDPGDDDPYTATIDFGAGSGPLAATATLTSAGPPQVGMVTGSFPYGDNGSFTVTVAVTDKDGATGTASFVVDVANLDPDAVIETAGPAFADVGDTIALDGRITDPGSDDITSTWDFDDGTSIDVQVSLVNPPFVDGLPSPSVDPRDVEHDVSHAFALACAYDVTLDATDDDGGSDDASILVIVTADPSLSRGAGYWQHQYRSNGKRVFSDAQLACYLTIASAMSSVFDEVRSAATIDQAHDDIFVAGLQGSMAEQLDRQLLTAWLNFANGAVELTELLDTDGDGILDTDFASVMAAAETVRLDPGATTAQLQQQRDILQRINGRDRV